MFFKKLLITILCVLTLSGVFAGSVSASGDDDENWAGLLDLQGRVNAVVTAFANAESEAISNIDEHGAVNFTLPNNLIAGNAGAFLGYATDEESSDGFFAGIASTLAALSARDTITLSYTALRAFDTSDDNDASVVSNNPLFGYAMYGRTLYHIGLVQPARGRMVNFGNMLMGAVLWVGYMLNAVVPLIFRLIIGLLILLNPFRLLGDIVPGVADFGYNTGTFLNPIINWISSMYYTLQNFGMWVVMPFMIAFAIFSLIFFKSTGAGRVKAIFIRMFIMILGVPIVGMLYTSSLEALADTMGSSNVMADNIITGTLIDTAAWVENQRLEPPIHGPLHMSFEIRPNGDFRYTGSNPRSLARQINRWNGIGPDSDHDNEWNTIGAGVMRQSGAQIQSGVVMQGAANNAMGNATISLITRFMNGLSYDAAAYNGAMRNNLGQDGGTITSEIRDTFSLDAEELLESVKTGGVFTTGNILYGNGTIYTITETHNRISFQSNACPTVFNNNHTARVDQHIGLSTLSTFTFLSTEFDEVQLTATSPRESASILTAYAIQSVSLVGVGGVRILNGIEAIVQLIAVGLLGIVFGLAMLFSAFRGGLRVIMSIPGTVLGTAKGLSGLIVNSFLIIIQIIATIFVYAFISDLLLLVGDLLESLFSWGFTY